MSIFQRLKNYISSEPKRVTTPGERLVAALYERKSLIELKERLTTLTRIQEGIGQELIQQNINSEIARLNLVIELRA